MFKLFAIGGYSHIGRNMTAISYKGKIIILDIGLDLEEYIKATEDDEDCSVYELQNFLALPDDDVLNGYEDDVIAIVSTHAHLDHIGGIPFLASKYKNAKIIVTPFSNAVLKRLYENHEFPVKNEIFVLNNNSNMNIDNDIKIDFVNITHSTPDSVMISLYMGEKKILYANDFKFDENPNLGNVSNIEKLEKLKGVDLLIMDSLYSDRKGFTAGESDAKQELEEVLEKNITTSNKVIITTFSSHIPRLKTIQELAKKYNRRIMFLGRSMERYIEAAREANIIDVLKGNEIVKYSSKIKRVLKKRKDELHNFIIVCSGHQAEPNAALTKIVKNKYIDFNNKDVIVFSSSIIPSGDNQVNRDALEKEIRQTGAKVFSDVHVSGHASREDHKKLLDLVKPKIVIPIHADIERSQMMKELVLKEGFECILLKEGDEKEF